jgi:hypothetical protein
VTVAYVSQLLFPARRLFKPYSADALARTDYLAYILVASGGVVLTIGGYYHWSSSKAAGDAII